MTHGRLVWMVALIAAASAPAALAVGMYFGGGLAAYGETVVTTDEILHGDMGASWAVGGGLAIPVWWRGGAVSTTLELTTDVSFSMIDKNFEEFYLLDDAIKITAIPIREAIVFGVGVGPGGMIKPYGGFGGGVTIAMWEAYKVPSGFETDSGTAVKATFSIPFGCEFGLTPNFTLGPRAEYVIITGEVEGYDWIEGNYFYATVPDIFFFGAAARFDF